MAFLFAFQENEAPKTFRIDFELMALLLGLMILVVISAAVIMRTRSVARSSDEEPPVVEHSLEHYQELRDQNLISAEEYQRIAANFGRTKPPDGTSKDTPKVDPPPPTGP